MFKRAMTSKEEHYEQLLGLSGAWKVFAVPLDLEAKKVEVEIGYDLSQPMECPECGDQCAHYDHREMREWRHLDTMQFETVLRCEVPRCKCPEHGVKTLRVPWAGKGSRFTLLFESFAIDVLKACSSVKAAAELMRVNWHQVNEIKRRAVARGLERRESEPIKYLGIDEKSFRKGHNYVSLLTDLQGSRVLDVVEGRDGAACDKLFGTLSEEQLKNVEAIAMDMWRAYIKAAGLYLPNADIVHDRFHISAHLNQAIDKVRRQEHKALSEQNDDTLKKSKYLWLTGFENLSEEMQIRFNELQSLGLKVGRAYAIKETFDHFWDYKYAGWAKKFFNQWYGWARRSKLEPVKRVAKMIKDHFENIITYLKHRISNATTEGFNGVIQAIKANARGFRSFENYRVAILFQCGKLDLKP
jgi:transposase